MNNVSSEVNKKRYNAINGLRAFSAIGIIMMHVLANGDYSLSGFVFEEFIPSFTNLVFLFMVISGFAMCCGYCEKIINNKISFEQFYKNRYLKIWPFFALLSLMDLVISPSVNSLYEVFANMTLCFGFLPKNISVIGVGWFLGVVFIFYLVFPFICFLLSNKRRAWFSFAVALIFNVVCSAYFEIGRTNFAYCLVYFLLGGLIYLYHEQIDRMWKSKYCWIVGLLDCWPAYCRRQHIMHVVHLQR